MELFKRVRKFMLTPKVSGFVPGFSFIIVYLISMSIVTVLRMPRKCLMKWVNQGLFLEHNNIWLYMQIWGSLKRLESWLMKCYKENFSWTAMISWCVHHDWPKEALEFYRMRVGHWNSKLSKFTISSAFPTSDSCIYNVEWIGFRWGSLECLSDMYGKCGEYRGG